MIKPYSLNSLKNAAETGFPCTWKTLKAWRQVQEKEKIGKCSGKIMEIFEKHAKL